MIVLSRREVVAGISSTLAASRLGVANAAPIKDRSYGKIAIIDTSVDSSDWAKRLKQEQNVSVVARYFARSRQDGLLEKRIAYNDENRKTEGNPERAKKAPELENIFAENLAIISVYQYNSDKPQKFLFGINDNGDINDRPKLSPLQAAEEEAKKDAHAANKQASWLNQPGEAPIYFGLDFNLIENDKYATYYNRHNKKTEFVLYPGTNRRVENKLLIEACHKYFDTLLSNVSHPLGVYGNGFANRYLRKNKLVTYSWVSESRSYDQTPEFLSDDSADDQWHLFQHHIDRRWFVSASGCTGYKDNGFDVDGNVQNPKYSSVGAWDKNGVRDVDPERTKKIFEERWVAKVDAPIYKEKKGPKLTDTQKCTQNDDTREWYFIPENHALRNRSVRVLSYDEKWLEVDINEDGERDGWCLRSDFVENIKKMPHWKK